jgi:hypothetical protein
MAEDVNFPLDQTRNTSTFQFLREFLQESDRPKRIEGQEEELNNPDPTQIDLESLESRVELFQGARQQADKDLRNPTDLKNQGSKQEIAEAERRELQGSREVADADLIDSVQEGVAVEEEDAVRNEPAIGTNEQTTEPIEELENRIQEDLVTNSSLGPQPSELRDDSDASAVETERGQNISSLI